jgi:long-chain acyl-CoA synthetase
VTTPDLRCVVAGPPLEPSGLAATLPAQLLHDVATFGPAVAVRVKELGRWREVTWEQLGDLVAGVAAGLRALGVTEGDRVAIASSGRVEWWCVDLAAQGIGAVSVGIDPGMDAPAVGAELAHSGASVLVAEDQEQLDKAIEASAACPALRHIVVIDPLGVDLDDPKVSSFERLAAGAGASTPFADFGAQVATLDPARPATIVYRVDADGPKGVVLSHANLMAAADTIGQLDRFTSDDEILSYLPPCHIAERLVTEVAGLAWRAVVNFGTGIEGLATDLRTVQPTVLFGVPPVWTKMHAGVEARMGDATRTKRALFARARRARGGLWSLLMQRPLRAKLGLSRARLALSGGAALPAEVLEFFAWLGVPVLEGFGQAETTALATVNRPGSARAGTFGPPVPGVEIAVSPVGEVLVRGPAVMLGYHGSDTPAVDPDGWFHTGTTGAVVDGSLTLVASDDHPKEAAPA